MKVQGKYWYILAQMFFDENALPYDLTPSHLEVVFKSPLCSIFGETVSTLPFSVLKYDKDSKTCHYQSFQRNLCSSKSSTNTFDSNDHWGQRYPCGGILFIFKKKRKHCGINTTPVIGKVLDLKIYPINAYIHFKISMLMLHIINDSLVNLILRIEYYFETYLTRTENCSSTV
ncbi:hypothetical protein Avbf_01334 [Armadillidium vulgare]|nr:hypothetical protein Avbf_01334 [Armadillidium vulgare]